MRTFVVFVVVVTCISKLTASPPKLGEKQADYTDFAENFRLIKCNIEGDDLTFEWFHNGIKLEPTSPKFLFFRNSILASETVTQDYQGTYQCKASNEDGTLLGPKINVVFSIVGTFNKSDSVLETKDATVGKDLLLVCPPRTFSRNVFYHWGGRRVTGAWFIPSKQHYMIMEDGSLLFANVKSEDVEFFNVDRNGVSCSIESKGKIQRLAFSQRFLFNEIGARNTFPFGPTIKTNLKDREVAKGTKFVVLRCGAVGLPTPDYSWTVTGLNGIERPITGGQDGYRLQDFNHILMIESLDTKHDGWYKCKAKSSYGGSEHTDEVKGRISVKGKPQWAPEGELSDASPSEGSGFKWSCKAFGNPDPSYTWLLNGVKLSSTDSYNIDGGDITFKSVSKDNQGLYQCTAENNFGHISSSALLKVLAPPTLLDSRKCNVSKMNLMFLVDGSGSVPSRAFREFKRFMQLLVKKFVVGPDAIHVGVLQYSSKVRTGYEFALGEHQTMEAVQDAISRVKYHYGAYTFGGHAMGMAKKFMDDYNRQDAKNVMVFLMDDGTWDKGLARKLSKTLRNSGTQIIILDLQNMKIMHDIADKGLEFTTAKLEENVEEVATEICA